MRLFEVYGQLQGLRAGAIARAHAADTSRIARCVGARDGPLARSALHLYRDAERTFLQCLDGTPCGEHLSCSSAACALEGQR